MPWLITPAQLDKFARSQKNVVILDATWKLSSDGLSPHESFLLEHIPGARFLNLDLFINRAQPAPNMLLLEIERVNQLLGSLGISNDSKIILYDNSSLHTSCRALWMFKVYGHSPQHLYILNGNLSTWKAVGGEIEDGEGKKNY